MSGADANHLQEVAEMFGVQDPPKVDVVKQVGPKEQVERVVECMHELGWSEVQIENGGIRYPWDPEDPQQRAAIGLAMYTCHAKFPIRTELLHPSEEMYRRLYDYFKDVLAPCLRSQGYEISPAPGWDHWLHTLQHDQEHWDPANQVPHGEYPEDACPRTPPEFQ